MRIRTWGISLAHAPVQLALGLYSPCMITAVLEIRMRSVGLAHVSSVGVVMRLHMR